VPHTTLNTSKTSTRRTGGRARRTALVAALAAAATLTALAAPAPPAAAAPSESRATAQQGRGCAVVYFDLGETLIHTEDDGTIRYLPEAARHLRELREAHIEVGLITNVPPEWGETDAERAAKLREIVDADWTGDRPFAWADFEGRILTPRTVEERKPSPVLFDRAGEASGGCHLVYEGETPEELEVARAAGHFTYRVGRAVPWPAYLPVPVVQAIAQLP
jgi:phosphoglycolate phosphatase-like HAD superfamily hydrolase